MMTDGHAPHIWYPNARGVVRCAFQDCQAEPTPEEAAQAIADAEQRVRMRIAIDYGSRRDQGHR